MVFEVAWTRFETAAAPMDTTDPLPPFTEAEEAAAYANAEE